MSRAPRILIVEDEAKIARLIADYLAAAGMETRIVDRGDAALAAHRQFGSDVVLLDLQLPGEDGLAVCRALRALPRAPGIIMVTARVDEVDRLLGLELGADDYVCKPFSPRELVARVRALLRRLPLADAAEADECVRAGRITLDRAARRCEVDGTEVALTPAEFAILDALVSQPRRVFTRAQLLERARGRAWAGYERNVDSHIKNLRRKLRAVLGADPIRSVYGVGYGLEHSAP